MNNATKQELQDNINAIAQARASEYLPIVTNLIVNDDENRWGNIFLADNAYEIQSVSFIHTPASSNADGAVMQLHKATTTGEFGASNELGLITDASFEGGDVDLKGFNLKSTAYTVQDATMTNVASSLTLAAGDRIVFGLDGTISSTIIGLVTTLKRV